MRWELKKVRISQWRRPSEFFQRKGFSRFFSKNSKPMLWAPVFSADTSAPSFDLLHAVMPVFRFIWINRCYLSSWWCGLGSQDQPGAIQAFVLVRYLWCYALLPKNAKNFLGCPPTFHGQPEIGKQTIPSSACHAVSTLTDNRFSINLRTAVWKGWERKILAKMIWNWLEVPWCITVSVHLSRHSYRGSQFN